MNRFLIRLLVVLTVILGVNYVGWRWLESLNWSACPWSWLRRTA
jgi:cellulose synthase (UDP-forming)